MGTSAGEDQRRQDRSYMVIMGPWRTTANGNFIVPKMTAAAAAAKSLQLCLYDPTDGSPPGPPGPWDSPGKSTGVGSHFLLQCMKVKSESEVAQSCPTLRDPVDCSPPGSSIHGIFQARVLEWGAIASSTLILMLSLKPFLPLRVFCCIDEKLVETNIFILNRQATALEMLPIDFA